MSDADAGSQSTIQGDYAALPSTIDQLCSEVARAIFEQGGLDTAQAHQYADQGGEGMRTYFNNWLSLPDPASFDLVGNHLRQAQSYLNAGGPAPSQNSTVQHTNTSGTSLYDVQPNKSLQRVVTDRSVFDKFDGKAMGAFQDGFLLNFGDCVDNQFATSVDLRSAMSVMAAIWKEARSNVAGIAEQALSMAKGLPGGSGELAAVLDLLGLAASVAGVVPGAGMAAGLIGAGVALTSTLASSPANPHVGVTDVFEISDWLEESLLTLSDQLKKAETAVDELLAAYVAKMNEQPHLFSLGAALDFLRNQDADHYVPAYDRNDPHEMRAEPPKMINYSHKMDDGAATLKHGATALNEASSACTSVSWARNYVGMAPIAGWPDMQACLTGLTDAVLDTARHTSDCAEQLRLVANLFDTTDHQVEGVMKTLRRHDQQVEAVELAVDRTRAPGQAPYPMGPYSVQPPQ